MLLDLVTVLVFLAGAFSCYLILSGLFQGGRRPAGRAAAPRAASRTMRNLLWFAARTVPQLPHEWASIERDMRRSGDYDPDAANLFLTQRNLALYALAGLAAAAVWGMPERPDLVRFSLISCAVAAVLCYSVPRFYLRAQAESRVRRIERGLPDALDMATMCLTGGIPLQETLARVTQEIAFAHPDVAGELEIVQRQADAGSMGQALRQFAQRIDSATIRSLASLVGQTERLGTNVARAIRDYSDTMRRTTRQQAEERASQSSIKLLFPVVLCLAPPIYILLLAPSMLELRSFVLKENRPGGALAPSVRLVPAVPDNAASPPAEAAGEPAE